MNDGKKLVSADDWATDENVPDPSDIRDVPVGWRVVVRPRPPEKVTKGGIIRLDADTQTLTETVGKVVAVGSQAWKDETKFDGPWADRGDTVMFGKYAGKRFEYGGVKYVLLNDDEIIARIPDPAKIRR